MADYIERELKKAERRAQVAKRIYDEFNIFERTGGAIKPAQPSISSLRYLHKNRGNIAGGSESILPPEVINDILNARNVVLGRYNIATSVTNLNPWKNPAQYTAEALHRIRSMQKGTIWAADVEWLAGGKMSFVSPVEVAIMPVEIENGLIKNLSKDNVISFAVRLPKNEADEIARLINTVKDTPRGMLPKLTDDELRTLADLINYAGKNTIDPTGIVARKTARPIVTRYNIHKYIDLIEDGFNNLKPDSASHAIDRADLGAAINRAMMQKGYKLEKDPLFIWHNGLAADVPVLERSFGNKDIAQIFGFEGKAQHLDTYVWLRSVVQDPLSLHKLHKKGKAPIQGPSTLGTLSRSLTGYEFLEHVSAEDVYGTVNMLDYMLRRRNVFKDIDVSKTVFGKDVKELFSIGSITRTPETPLNMAYEMTEDGWKARTYQNLATYRHALHRIVNEFETEYSGKKYYGVVLHNIDDDVVSVLAYENVRDLQNAIQQNFVMMDSAVRHRETRQYIMQTRARREYAGMFRGTKDSPKLFERYMHAYEYIQSSPIKARMRGGKLSSAATQRLVDEGILTQSQAEKFAYMYPRIKSEYEILKTLKEDARFKALSNDQKAVALALFKDRLGEHVEDVVLPDLYRQAQIWDPVSKIYRTVDARTSSTLANSLMSIALEDGGNLTDAVYRLRGIVAQLSSEGTIERNKASKVIRTMYNVLPYHDDPTRGVHDIALNVATNIIEEVGEKKAYNVIKDQESLTARTLSAKAIRELKDNSTISSVVANARRYFKIESNLAIIDPDFEEKLAIIDRQLAKHVSLFSEKVAMDMQNLGPTPLMEQVRKLAREYESKGIGLNAWISRSSKSPGLELALYDLSTATQVVDTTMRGSAVRIFIPLVDDQGFINIDNLPRVNMLVPTVIDYNTRKARLNTTQHVLFDTLTYKDTINEISQLIKDKRYSEAADLAARRIRHAVQGVPAGSRYSRELISDTVAGTRKANLSRAGYIDYNSLVYSATRAELGKAIGLNRFKEHGLDSNLLIRSVRYGGSSYNIVKRIGLDETSLEYKMGSAISEILRDTLGLKYGDNALKGERLQSGYLSVEQYDPRIFGVFGFYSDTGRENPRQMLNYYRLSPNANLDDATLKRLTTIYMGTEESFRAEPAITALNLRTAFMTDKDIAAIVNREEVEKLPQIRRPTVHDDMMLMRADVAKAFDVFQKKVIHLEPDEVPVSMLDELAATGGVIRKGDVIAEAGGRKRIYEEKFDAIVREVRINEEKGTYDIIIDQFIPTTIGTKFQGFDSGNKFTVGLLTKEEIIRLFGEEYADIEAIVNVGVKKLPGDLLASQLNMMMYEMQTVGKITKEQIQAAVEEVLERAMGKDPVKELRKRGLRIEAINDSYRLVFPTRMIYDINVQEYINAVTEKLGGKNIITTKTGHKVLTGLMGFIRSDVADYMGGVGEEGEFVKIGLRELEMMYNRSRLHGVQTNRLLELMEGAAFQESSSFLKEGAIIREALAAASGQHRPFLEDIPTVRVVNQPQLQKGDILFSQLRLMPTESRGYLRSELRGTIVDPGLFDGKPFFLELPTPVTMSDAKGRSYTVDKALIAPLKLRGEQGEVHLNEIQKAQRQLFNAIFDYNAATDDIALAEAKDSLQRAVENLHQEYGRAIMHSKGYIAENALSHRVSHSGIFKYRTIDPNSYIYKYANTLDEGYAVMSRYDLMDMLSGVRDADKIMEMAEKEGIPMISIRWPVKDVSTMQVNMVKVLSEEAESSLPVSLKGNVWVTLGTQISQNADMDGDTHAWLLPQIAGSKAKGAMIDTQANQELLDLFKAEQRYSRLIANQKIEELAADEYLYDVLMSSDTLKAKVSMYDEIIGTEARLQKRVGIFSNMATRYRRAAEITVNSMTQEAIKDAASNPWLVTSYFMSAVEQMPISAKRLSEQLTEGTTAEQFKKYIGAVENLYAALSNFNIDEIIDQSKTLGVFKQNELGEWIFQGGVKDQAKITRAVFGRDLTEADIRTALDLIQRHTSKNVIWDSFLNVALAEPGSAVDAIRFGYDISNPSKTSPLGYYVLDKFLHFGVGDEKLIEKVDKLVPEAMSYIASKGRDIGGAFNAENISNVTGKSLYTIGQSKVDEVSEAVGSAFKGATLKGLGTAAMIAMGAWAISGMFRGPNIEHEPVEAHEDQAPSSDGTYVNPIKYAVGAPPGAGPTAYVTPKGTGYEKINVVIRGNVNRGMTNEEVAQMISDEVIRQTGINMNIKIVSEDNRQTIDRSWLQMQFTNVLKTGYAY